MGEHWVEADYDYYGGYLVAESIGSDRDVHLLAAAPELQDLVMMFVARLAQPWGVDPLVDSARRLLHRIATCGAVETPPVDPRDATRDDLDPPVPDTDDNPDWPA